MHQHSVLQSPNEACSEAIQHTTHVTLNNILGATWLAPHQLTQVLPAWPLCRLLGCAQTELEQAHPWTYWEGSWVSSAAAGPKWLPELVLESQLWPVLAPLELQKKQPHLVSILTALQDTRNVSAQKDPF